MPTKLSKYCEGIIEAAWLAAVIVVPVFFNVYSSRIFEPDKITLLRTLALVTLSAWIIKLISEGGVRWEHFHFDKNGISEFFKIPLIAPVVALALVYIISTIFSITPRVSLLGSYQRLQGTYTTFSYLVIFAAIAVNLRRRAQIERLISAMVISSLPVSLYGVLQHYSIDPIPWGGDTTVRIAANMGNSIFVAAYLIMAFPLTLIRIVQSFQAILKDQGSLIPNFTRSTGYVFIAALQLVAIYFSGSRGPWLGLGTSIIFIGLGLSLIWRKRWMTIAGVSLIFVASIFLVVLNTPNGPLEGLRSQPGIGRLGQLLDAESRTGRVRTLIWQGASELVLPHAPLEYPDGHKDPFNFLRPLIGYGPESMYVAYNRFYPPELTQVEQRNASPDRSHNETWDSLVITGLLGLIVYLTLFGSIIYFGLRWLGLVDSKRKRNLFLGLYIGGGLITSLVFVLWKGIPYFGVSLPFGMILGVIVYLLLTAMYGKYSPPEAGDGNYRSYLILGILAVVMAHFVEINFGIAIVATRTYFWALAGLLLVVGYLMPQYMSFESAPSLVKVDAKQKPRSLQKKKRRSSRSPSRSDNGAWPVWLRQALVASFIVAVVIVTLGYDFISNSQGAKSPMSILWSSMVMLGNAGGRISYGVLAMILTSWVIASLILASESEFKQEIQDWLKMIAAILGVSLVLGLFFWLWHASGLAALASSTASNVQDVLTQIGRYEGLLTRYYIYLLLLVFGGAFFIPEEWPAKAPATTWATAGLASMLLIATIALAAYTNLRVIQADIAFKLADPFTHGNQWPVAIQIYDRANELAPNEDYYYLFLGRAYLEEAKTLTNSNERDQLITQAEHDLKRAQTISPLNTDHTANLARLYSLWASYANDPNVRNERGKISSNYFEKAVMLSPKNARLWDEWGLLFLNVLQQPNEAYKRLAQALEIDPYYDWTYGLIGDYYSRQAQSMTNEQEKQNTLKQASKYYNKAMDLVSPSDHQMKYNYALALGGVEAQLDKPDAAISAYQEALNQIPTTSEGWRIEETLARLYAQVGDRTNALVHAQNALAAAPQDQQDRLQTLVVQLQNQP
jgi:tetratricopeptide (TPR) repeat protein/O-antigen ligase